MSNLVPFATLLLVSLNLAYALRCQVEQRGPKNEVRTFGQVTFMRMAKTHMAPVMPMEGMGMAAAVDDGDDRDGPKTGEECPAQANYCYTVKCGDIHVKGCANPRGGPRAACQAIKQICREREGDANPYCNLCRGENCNQNDGRDEQ